MCAGLRCVRVLALRIILYADSYKMDQGVHSWQTADSVVEKVLKSVQADVKLLGL